MGVEPRLHRRDIEVEGTLLRLLDLAVLAPVELLQRHQRAIFLRPALHDDHTRPRVGTHPAPDVVGIGAPVDGEDIDRNLESELGAPLLLQQSVQGQPPRLIADVVRDNPVVDHPAPAVSPEGDQLHLDPIILAVDARGEDEAGRREHPEVEGRPVFCELGAVSKLLPVRRIGRLLVGEPEHVVPEHLLDLRLDRLGGRSLAPRLLAACPIRLGLDAVLDSRPPHHLGEFDSDRRPVPLRRIGPPQVKPRVVTVGIGLHPPADPDDALLVGMPDRLAAPLAGEVRSMQPLRLDARTEVLPGQRLLEPAGRARHVEQPLVAPVVGLGDPAGALDHRRRHANDLRVVEARRPALRELFWIALVRGFELGQVIHDDQTAARTGEVSGRSRRRHLQRSVPVQRLLVEDVVAVLATARSEDLQKPGRLTAHGHPLVVDPLACRAAGRMDDQRVQRRVLVPRPYRGLDDRNRLAPLRGAADRHLPARMLRRQHLVDLAQKGEPRDVERPLDRGARIELDVLHAPSGDVRRQRRCHRPGHRLANHPLGRRQESHSEIRLALAVVEVRRGRLLAQSLGPKRPMFAPQIQQDLPRRLEIDAEVIGDHPGAPTKQVLDLGELPRKGARRLPSRTLRQDQATLGQQVLATRLPGGLLSVQRPRQLVARHRSLGRRTVLLRRRRLLDRLGGRSNVWLRRSDPPFRAGAVAEHLAGIEPLVERGADLPHVEPTRPAVTGEAPVQLALGDVLADAAL